jgi:UDP-N-acetylmuramoylalanine--D-glutamate ligase
VPLLAGKRVVVVGLGASGVAAARLCLRRGASVVANDGKPRDALTDQARQLEALGARLVTGSHDHAGLGEADIIVVSPGVPPLAQIEGAEARGAKVWSEIELAARAMTAPAPIVAIGGTNGKSTTTSLVGALLQAHGLRTFLGGNLGEPFADHVDEPFDAVVLEVSSFQMERVDHFHPHVCALLNVTDDHLDRYDSFEEYAQAKGNAFRRQTDRDWAIVPFDDTTCLAQARRGHGRVVTFGPRADLDVSADEVVDRRTGDRFARPEMTLVGHHNALNVAAAIACVRPFQVQPSTIREVLHTTKGLPHRTALVAEVQGVRFYDDSKGTNVGASVTAIEGLPEARVVLIAGGRDKMGSYGPLVDALARKGRGVVVIGEAADAIARALGNRLPVRHASNMADAVRAGAAMALPGDAVLLSPACASFDMFRDYKHRGDEFVSAVTALERELRA